jgi:FkbM family methyltransferase
MIPLATLNSTHGRTSTEALVLKLRNLFELLGVRGKPKRYNYETTSIAVEGVGNVTLAQWSHPSETSKTVSAEAVQAYRAFISPGDFCIDIGAHSGDSTLPIALATGPNGAVLAVEPNPFVYHVLEKNARANRTLANIIPLFAAATPEQGIMRFEYSDSGFCNGGRHEGISPIAHAHAFNLDVFGVDLANELNSDYADLLPKLKFIKTDCEGFDLAVLESLTEVIDAHRPFIKSEVFSKTPTAARKNLLRFFLDREYEVHRVVGDHVRTGEQVGLKNIDAWKHYDVLCTP